MTMNSHRSGSFFLPGGTNPFPTCSPRAWVTDCCCGLCRGPCEHHPYPASAPDLESKRRPHSYDAGCAAILVSPTAPTPVAGVYYTVDCRVYDPCASVTSAEGATIGRTSPYLQQHENVTDPVGDASATRWPRHPLQWCGHRMCSGAPRGYFAGGLHNHGLILLYSARVIFDRHSILAITQVSYTGKDIGNY